jgi:uncharacterized membrane protein YeaQ/YmgE (transglycosylase-associated protein family)
VWDGAEGYVPRIISHSSVNKHEIEGDPTMEFLWFILIGIAAGWLAGQFMKGGGYGLVGDLIVGVVGALLGGWLFGLAGIAAGGLVGQLVVATIGAMVLILLLRLIKKKA